MAPDYYGSEFNRYKTEIVVSELLKRLGLSESYKGFPYVSEAVVLCVEDNSRIYYVTKALYPEIAKKFGIDGKIVERAIRHTVSKFWDRQAQNDIESIVCFGTSAKPTNTQFIAAVSERARILLKRK